MIALIALIFGNLYLAWVAMDRYGLGMASTFFELLSGPMALNWGLPPAEPGNLFGYLFSAGCALLWVAGMVKDISGLRGFAAVAWFMFGVLGTFYYAT